MTDSLTPHQTQGLFRVRPGRKTEIGPGGVALAVLVAEAVKDKAEDKAYLRYFKVPYSTLLLCSLFSLLPQSTLYVALYNTVLVKQLCKQTPQIFKLSAVTILLAVEPSLEIEMSAACCLRDSGTPSTTG